MGLDYKEYVVTNPKFFRPGEVDTLRGDYSKAKKVLGWEPTISFDELITGMVENDLQYLSQKDIHK